MRRVMSVSKTNPWNHLLHDIEEILFRAFPDLARRQRGGGVHEEEMADPIAHLVFLDQRGDLRCQINNFLLLACFNSECVHV